MYKLRRKPFSLSLAFFVLYKILRRCTINHNRAQAKGNIASPTRMLQSWKSLALELRVKVTPHNGDCIWDLLLGKRTVGSKIISKRTLLHKARNITNHAKKKWIKLIKIYFIWKNIDCILLQSRWIATKWIITIDTIAV